jgi:hypothetical protein
VDDERFRVVQTDRGAVAVGVAVAACTSQIASHQESRSIIDWCTLHGKYILHEV